MPTLATCEDVPVIARLDCVAGPVAGVRVGKVEVELVGDEFRVEPAPELARMALDAPVEFRGDGGWEHAGTVRFQHPGYSELTQPLARAHLRTSRWPPRAACAQV